MVGRSIEWPNEPNSNDERMPENMSIVHDSSDYFIEECGKWEASNQDLQQLSQNTLVYRWIRIYTSSFLFSAFGE